MDRARGILDGLFQGFHEGAQEPLDRFRLLGGEFGVHHDGIAVEIDAVVGHQQDHDVVHLHAAVLEVDIGGEGKARDGVDLAGGEHGLAHRKADILDRHL